jgi:hypothetical protein
MSNVIVSANMGLAIPVTGVDPGPDYANNVNASLSKIDTHNHAPGNGVQITPSGLNISGDLSFIGNNATSMRSVRFLPQGAPLSGALDLGCIYESGVDLYYNDGNGNQVRITQSGGVAGSPGSISGLTSPASATYVSFSSTFVWQSAANTPANMDMASLFLRNLSANSFYMEVSPPSGMASNSAVVLPAVPGVPGFVTLDASGNYNATAIPVANGLVGGNLTNHTVTRTQIVALGKGIGSGSGSYSNSTGSLTQVDSATLTCSGSGDVMIALVGNSSTIGTNGGMAVNSNSSENNASFWLYLFKDGSYFNQTLIQTSYSGATVATLQVPPPGVLGYDVTPTAGSHTYQVFASLNTGIIVNIFNVTLIAKELL